MNSRREEFINKERLIKMKNRDRQMNRENIRLIFQRESEIVNIKKIERKLVKGGGEEGGSKTQKRNMESRE